MEIDYNKYDQRNIVIFDLYTILTMRFKFVERRNSFSFRRQLEYGNVQAISLVTKISYIDPVVFLKIMRTV